MILVIILKYVLKLINKDESDIIMLINKKYKN